MSEKLRDFLVELASNSDLMTRFAADPAGTLDDAGLTAADKDAVLTRDSDRIRRALGAGAADHLTQVSSAKPSKKTGARKRPGTKKAPSKTGRQASKKR